MFNAELFDTLQKMSGLFKERKNIRILDFIFANHLFIYQFAISNNLDFVRPPDQTLLQSVNQCSVLCYIIRGDAE